MSPLIVKLGGDFVGFLLLTLLPQTSIGSNGDVHEKDDRTPCDAY